VFTLATNSRNAELCRRIPVGAKQTDPWTTLREQCGFQVNSPHPSNRRYGPEVPVDDDRHAR
jgi:hypothetical protein